MVSNTLFVVDKMIIFNTDLDNTLIYSYKHDIGTDKLMVELYQGREISFVTKETSRLLKELNELALIVPTTTRSIEQYERIDLGLGTPQYALVCNGGVLLKDGQRDADWYKESLEVIKDCDEVMAAARDLLENEPARYFEVRFIENLFLFTKCKEPEDVIKKLAVHLNSDMVDVFNNGDKVYVVPKSLSKGNAINRLRDKLNPKKVIAAGDSEFDISMVVAADVGFVPKDFKVKYNVTEESVLEVEGNRLFSEEMLSMLISEVRK